MVRDNSQVFVAGPPVVARGIGREIERNELGGSQIHARKSGAVDNEAESEEDLFAQIKSFLSYMPQNVWQVPPVIESDDPADRRDEELLSMVPRDRMRPYDVRKMLLCVLDRDSFFEIGRYFGGSQVTGLARLSGRPVAVLANDPTKMGGSMDGPASDKLAKFVDMADTFNLPVVNFVDQPGFMLGVAAEEQGTIKRGTRALIAVAQAKVPWASIVVRRVYGVAGGGHQNSGRWNYRVAWPSGDWGSLPIEGGVMAAYRREIEAAPDPKARQQEIEDKLNAMRSPFRTADAFNIEDIIDPRDTRPVLCDWVEMAYNVLPTLTGEKLRGMRP
jgi:acetyl-CoA carboxylase carboxyltransferase component